MAELKPCPFCGEKLKRKMRKMPWGGTKEIYMHPDNDCVILALYIDGTNMYAWNERVSDG